MRPVLNERLRELRKKRGFETQKAFVAHAQRYGYHVSAKRYGRIERGEVVATIDDVVTICKALEISSDRWLFDYQDPRELKNVKMLSDAEFEIVRQLIFGLLGLRQ